MDNNNNSICGEFRTYKDLKVTNDNILMNFKGISSLEDFCIIIQPNITENKLPSWKIIMFDAPIK